MRHTIVMLAILAFIFLSVIAVGMQVAQMYGSVAGVLAAVLTQIIWIVISIRYLNFLGGDDR